MHQYPFSSHSTRRLLFCIEIGIISWSLAFMFMPVQAASPRDVGEEVIASTGSSWNVITRSGITQTFKILNSTNSPLCEGGQDVKLKVIELPLLSDLPTPYCTPQAPVGLKITAAFYDGSTYLGETFLNYVPENTGDGPQVARGYFGDYPNQVVLKANKTYTVLFSSSAPAPPLRFRGWPPSPTPTVTNTPTRTNTPTPPPGLSSPAPQYTVTPTPCVPATPDSPPYSNTVSLQVNSSNPYDRGRASTGISHDVVMTLEYVRVTNVSVLALIYDPFIGQPVYEDKLGTFDLPAYNEKLSKIHKNWADYEQMAETFAKELTSASGGMVTITVDKLEINDFAPHVPGHVVWPEIAATPVATELPTLTPLPTRIDIPNFTKWTAETWPGYPDLPGPGTPSGDIVGRRAAFPHGEQIPRFDYVTMLQTTHPNKENKSIATLVNEGVYDEIWIITEPTSRVAEGGMLLDPNDPGINLNGLAWKPDPTGTPLARSVTFGGYNPAAPENMLHSYGHRAENVFAVAAGGNIRGSCLVNRSEHNDFNHFTRIVACFDDARPPAPTVAIPTSYFGSIGVIHKSFNAPAFLEGEGDQNGLWVDPSDINDRQGSHFMDKAESDAADWFNYPNLTGYHYKVGGASWSRRGYYWWWLNHLPRYLGQHGTLTPTPTVNLTRTATPTPVSTRPLPNSWNNLWPALARPGCFQFDRTFPRDEQPTP